MHRRTGEALAQTGVTADQFVVLAALADAAALTQSELVARTSSDPNTVRAMLVLLERRSLIVRRPHPTDGRARSVSLTPQGKTIYRRLWRQSEPLRKRMVGALAPAETTMLIDQLQRIVKALEPKRAARANSTRRRNPQLAN
jgi:DNA-binding MarR family transcriptional regulator